MSARLYRTPGTHEHFDCGGRLSHGRWLTWCEKCGLIVAHAQVVEVVPVLRGVAS